MKQEDTYSNAFRDLDDETASPNDAILPHLSTPNARQLSPVARRSAYTRSMPTSKAQLLDTPDVVRTSPIRQPIQIEQMKIITCILLLMLLIIFLILYYHAGGFRFSHNREKARPDTRSKRCPTVNKSNEKWCIVISTGKRSDMPQGLHIIANEKNAITLIDAGYAVRGDESVGDYYQRWEQNYQIQRERYRILQERNSNLSSG